MSERIPTSNLPVEDAIAGVRAALNQHGRAVLVAPPGAGKTTLVPLRLLDESWVRGRRIVMLEPRRLAARAAARRMAEMLGERVGDTVGYQTRDERKIGASTRVEVLTEGILTRRLQRDPGLEGTALVIFDEVHERNVSTDLGLAFLLDATSTLGSDVRILAMSATAQSNQLSALLEDSPVVLSEGRSHPVDIRYLPRNRNDRLEIAVTEAVLTALRETDGDILVFLPGIGEINRTMAQLTERLPAQVSVARLAGALPLTEQDEALSLNSSGNRRVVLSTDIAETSLTVQGVRVVIDAGLSRVPRFDPRTGLTELVTVTSSRASADQRSGRAGRTEPGVAYRLWSRIEDSTRLGHLPAEITQVDLCGVALDIAAWGTPVENLSFCDRPPERAMRLARDTLQMLHLIDDAGVPTALGRSAMGLPLHPRLATMVARNAELSPHGWIACVVAALLEERDVLRGQPSALPVDLSVRAKAVLQLASHDQLDRGAARRVRDGAADLARRASVTPSEVDPVTVDSLVGKLLLAAYPDRLAKRRSTPGQFVMRGGGETRCDPRDQLANDEYIVAADVDSRRGSSLLRRGAGVDVADIAPVLGDDVEVDSNLIWDKSRDDLVLRVVRRVGSIRLDERDLEPTPGEDTTHELCERVRATSLGILGDKAEQFRQRVGFVRHHQPDEWPDFSTRTLLASINEWLAPFLVGATGRIHLEAIDLEGVLQSMLGWDRCARLDSLAPATYRPARGRPVEIDYSNPDVPTIAVRVQHMFGVAHHPTVMSGRVPLRIQLLSPADRPVQITTDLPGFWKGTWLEVRKDMAGRYPKHDWPMDPLA